MAKKTWLVVDSPFLCYRSFYTTGGMSYDGDPTGVIYGFLQAILTLQEEHATNDVIFTFDSKHSLREQQHPEYKQQRRQKEQSRSEEEKEALAGLRSQMRLLRTSLLEDIGFRNILCQKGREADDCIAKVCECLPTTDRIIIVSGDKDLYQLLSKNIILWNPIKKHAYTRNSLLGEFGIGPQQWAAVKALSGCASDGIKGIKGVGEKTAARYLLGKLNPKQKTYQKIVSGYDIYTRNLPLVTLPYPGTKIPVLQQDEVTQKKWRKVLEKLGIKSLLKKV
jgi:DNA polymerase-1